MLAAVALSLIISSVVGSEPTDPPGGKDAFGVSLDDLRDLVFRQPFVSSCQYSILKSIKMYDDAKNQCRERLDGQGRIATIRSSQENEAVNNLFVATYGHGIDNKFFKSNPSNYIWIGLSRDDEYSEWQWDDPSTPFNYTNWKPGHVQVGNNVRMNRQGYWETSTNLMHHPIVCERAAKYVVYKKRMSHPSAGEVCANMSMTLARVQDEEENDELAREASRSLGSPYLDRNFENVNQVWVGGYEGDDGLIYWADETPAEYTNFELDYGLEFAGTGNVKISIDKMRKDWTLEKGTEERSFACQCPNPGQDQYKGEVNFFPDDGTDFDLQPLASDCRRRFYPDNRQETYEGARMACRKQGLRLAQIESEEENRHAVRVMNNKHRGQFANRLFDGANWFWIGASDVLVEGAFLWEDSTPLNFTNWGNNQPDNAHPLRGGQNHVAVYRGTGLWDDAHAYKAKAFLCYNKDVSLEEDVANRCNSREEFVLAEEDDEEDNIADDTTDEETDDNTDEETDDNTDDNTDSNTDETGTEIIDEDITEEPGTKDTPKDDIQDEDKINIVSMGTQKDCIKREYRGDYYVSTTTASYANAKTACESRGLQLASVFDAATNARLRNLVLNRVPVSGYILATMGELSWFWVGLEVQENESFRWLGGNQTTYENFDTYYKRTGYSADEDKTTVAISKVDGTWEWKNSESRYMFICEDPALLSCSLSKVLRPNEPPCRGVYEEREQLTYNLQYRSFEEARTKCVIEGGRLARPDSADDNERMRLYAEEKYPLPLTIKSNPRNKENWIWLDIDDIEEEGRYVDFTGEEVGFYNWGTGQPDNKYPRRGGQDRIAMNKNTGKWFDSFEERRFQFICQRVGWQCNPNDLMPTVEPSTSSPVIEAALRFTARPSSYIANIGSTVTFTAEYSPEEANLRWMMDGKTVAGRSKRDRIHQDEVGNLVVQNVQAKDEGVVSCVLFQEGRGELVANSALAITEEKLLSYIIVNGDGGETYSEAVDVCARLGGSIVCPQNEAENTAVAQLVKNKNVWLGIRPDNGVYTLHDGLPLEYTNWSQDEPSLWSESGAVLNGNQNSAEFGLWYARPADQVHGTVCERVPRKSAAKRRKNEM